MHSPYVSISFDDGWKSQYNNALSVLDRFQVKSTFYIVTGHLNKPNQDFMGEVELIDLYIRGHEIGAHTVTHPNFALSTPYKMKEIISSKRHLTSIGITVKTFAYPFGQHNWIAEQIVKMSGYLTARIVGHDFNKGQLNPYRIKGKFVIADTELSDVECWIKEAKAKNYWLVLIFHDISDYPGTYGCTAHLLTGIIQECIRNGIQILPVSEVFEKINLTYPRLS